MILASFNGSRVMATKYCPTYFVAALVALSFDPSTAVNTLSKAEGSRIDFPGISCEDVSGVAGVEGNEVHDPPGLGKESPLPLDRSTTMEAVASLSSSWKNIIINS